MYRTHDVGPRLHCVVGGIFQPLVVRVAEPARADIIGSAAAEVTVLDVTGGTGLAEGVKAGDLGGARRAASAVDGCEQHAVHDRRVVLIKDPDAARGGVFQHGVALLVGDEGVGGGGVIDASAAEHDVGGSHFQHRYTVGESADRHGREVVVLFVELDGEPLGEEFIADLRREITDDACRDAVGGDFQTLDNGDVAPVMTAVVARPLDGLTVVPDGHRLVGDRRGEFDDA